MVPLLHFSRSSLIYIGLWRTQKMNSKVKFMNHPIHPMLIVFPIAFYTATFASFIAYQASMNVFWFQVGYVCNIAGVITALLAAIPGFIDWAIGIPSKHEAKRVGLVHMSLNVIALLLFAINAWVLSGQFNESLPD